MFIMKILKELLALYENRVEFTATSMKAALATAMKADSSSKYNTPLELVTDMAEKADPTKKKIYLTFLARMYAAKQFKVEDFSRLKQDLTTYVKIKSKLEKKDINHYKNLNDFYNDIEEKETAEKEHVALKEKGAEILINTPNFKVVSPKTEESACYYGSGTKWCTAFSEENGNTGQNAFNTYNDQGKLYIVIAKINGKEEKFQFHYETSAAMNKRDQPITAAEIKELSAIPQYKDFLEHLIKKHYEPLIEME